MQVVKHDAYIVKKTKISAKGKNHKSMKLNKLQLNNMNLKSASVPVEEQATVNYHTASTITSEGNCAVRPTGAAAQSPATMTGAGGERRGALVLPERRHPGRTSTRVTTPSPAPTRGSWRNLQPTHDSWKSTREDHTNVCMDS